MNNHFPSAALTTRPASFADIIHIQQIAHTTWPIAYNAILDSGQLPYMLNRFYSTSSLETQMKEHHYFFLSLFNFLPVGFASFSRLEAGIFKLQKLYVLPGTQKQGIGLGLLTTVEEHAKNMGCMRLQLNVNRNNKAKDFYLKNHFTIIKEENIDIGDGYFMNDYIMEKVLQQNGTAI